MSLSAPAVFAPFVRMELLQWDPMYSGRAGAALLHDLAYQNIKPYFHAAYARHSLPLLTPLIEFFHISCCIYDI